MNERMYYDRIKTKLTDLMKEKFGECHLEVTADKRFSNKLKAKIGSDRNIIFHFLKEAVPDITGYFKSDDLFSFFDEFVFVVVEVKCGTIKLDDIYQLRKYSELFDAKLTILVTFEEIPEEVKRLSDAVKQLLSQPDGEKIVIVNYDPQTNIFKNWFPKNPFEESWL